MIWTSGKTRSSTIRDERGEACELPPPVHFAEMRLLPATATVVAPGLNSVAWLSLISVPRPRPQPHMNLFGDIFGGDDVLKAQENFCERPLLPELVQKAAASFVLQEKLFSMSGEVCHSL